jgi:D-alanine--poly(phosphoribitol) ligase subunit 1
MDELLARLASQAARRPDHPAVIEDGIATSYARFLDRARRLANALAAHGTHPRVMIHLPQGTDAYVAMFATGEAGGFYAPTNVMAPVAKQQLVLEQFAPDVVISTQVLFDELMAGLPPPRPVLIQPVAADSLSPLDQPRLSHELAYVIFTSGSTGVPKGVMVPRAAVVHYINWALSAMKVTPNDRWSQHPNLAFDLSVLDIYGALCGGATLFPLTSAMHRLMPAKAIRDLGLTIWNSVPSVIALMMRAGQMTADNLTTLRLMTFCGEPLLPEHLEALFAARADLVVHNTYGPTEATVSCTVLRLTALDYSRACRTTVAIGEPIPDMALHLMHGESPSEGELVIIGPQLARGYWNNSEATADVFRELEVDGTAVPAYYTGDWAERIGDQIFFVGRRDSQVKILGYRLELGEVNAALRHCGFPTAVSAVVGGALHAYLETDAPVDTEALRARLAALLEPHAVPAYFHALSQLPRNANDKIDLLALIAAENDQ